MDRKAKHKENHLCNSKQLEVNAKVFIVIRKSNFSTPKKVKKVKKLLGKKP